MPRRLIPLAAGLCASALAALFWRAAFGGWSDHWLTYDLPLVLPFVTFCLDRASRAVNVPARARWLDAALLILALLRAFMPIPGYSGHALFLGYSLLTSREITARTSAGLVLLLVLYFKLFIWQDATALGGLALAAGAAWGFARLCRACPQKGLPPHDSHHSPIDPERPGCRQRPAG